MDTQGIKAIDFHEFETYKPIEVWQADSIDHALDLCEEKKDQSSYVYLEVQTDRFIQEHEIKAMKNLKSDILEILPMFEDFDQDESVVNITEEPIQSIFEKFYMREKNVAPTKEITDLLMTILGEEDETH